MVRSTVIGLVVVLLVVKAVSSLTWIATRWEERTQTITLPAQVTKTYEIVTQNGTVEFAGEDEHLKTAELIAHVKGGSNTDERAQQALDAIEVTTEGKDTDTCRIGWRWRKTPETDWSATVDFTLRAPKNANVRVENHNGRVEVKNLTGNANITSHNGEIETESSGESLEAKTDNGEIDAHFSGRKIKLQSDNGRINADLSESHAIEGELGTHNGRVEVTVGKDTSCELAVKTRHGRSNSRSGKIGSGGGRLVVSTHNGGILIHNPKQQPVLTLDAKHQADKKADDDDEDE
jgi:Putative adhesin